MKMEVTQAITIAENTIEYMLCFYKNHWNFFQFSHSGQLRMLLEMF